MNKIIVVGAVSLTALLYTARPVFAQATHEFFGPVIPIEFGSKGERHWMEYGYYGPWAPPLVWEEGLTKVARHNHARGALKLSHATQPRGILGRHNHTAARSKDTE
jgi:hypothetical protein